MRTQHPDVLVVTPDLGLPHVVALAAPGEFVECQTSFGLALAAIAPETRLLVVDAAIDAPMARLLATLFVDQRANRRAILVQAEMDLPLTLDDERITVLPWPVSPGAITDAVGNSVLSDWMSELQASLVEEPVAV